MGLRYYAATFVLMTMAPLRFCDARDVYGIWLTESACGASIDNKSKNADPMAWAVPKSGLFSNALWIAPIARLRGGEFSPKGASGKLLPAGGHGVET